MRKIRVLKLLAFENSDTTLMTTRSRASHMTTACMRQSIHEAMTAKHTSCAPKSKQRSIPSRWTSFRTVPSIASKKMSLCLLQLIHQLVRPQSPSTPSRSRSKDNSALFTHHQSKLSVTRSTESWRRSSKMSAWWQVMWPSMKLPLAWSWQQRFFAVCSTMAAK